MLLSPELLWNGRHTKSKRIPNVRINAEFKKQTKHLQYAYFATKELKLHFTINNMEPMWKNMNLCFSD